MISTHILDTTSGRPAAGVNVRLNIRSKEEWKEITKGETNEDGRLSFECEKKEGVYQLVFEVETYLKKSSQEYFYPRIPVVFQVADTKRKYHVPLLLNPFGYSTYRGS